MSAAISAAWVNSVKKYFDTVAGRKSTSDGNTIRLPDEPMAGWAHLKLADRNCKQKRQVRQTSRIFV